jgi:hypothetical protein
MDGIERGIKKQEVQKYTAAQLKTFASQIVGRAQLMSQLGFQYDGNRDIYKALGYKVQLEYNDFYTRYIRQAIAKAVIDRPVKATWQGKLGLVESDESEDTAFEEAWEKLERQLKLKTILSRVDRLTGIGRYGVLVLGLNDVKKQEDFENPVKPGTHKLLYVRPFGENTAKITTYDADPKSPRYGKPLMYTIESAEVNEGSVQSSIAYAKVHYSRVIHITDGSLESDIFGTPVLESVFNHLMDLEKLVGGDAEMFWRGARPGYEGKVDKEYQMTDEM